ncbi:MAG: sulfatase-like hydrolase/transferase [Thermoanaerobaculia bacterium]
MPHCIRLTGAVVSFLLVVSCSPRNESSSVVAAQPGAPVIVVSIDTLRADHLPAYGYQGVETPAIDAFRRDAVLFQNAYSPCPMTLPSHVSILTGLLPQEHGVRNNLGYKFDGGAHATLPGLLKKSGYATGAAVSAYMLRGDTGLAASFDFYDDRLVPQADTSLGEFSRPGPATLDVSRNWIDGKKGEPFFFLFHIFEPHTPYDPPEPYKSRYASAYDGEIAASDSVVGEFFEFLKSSGLYDRAIIIVLSDHGEGLGDHGEGEHGLFLYRETIRVPLLLKLPKSERGGTTVGRPVQLIDVLPTIASLTGDAAPSGLRGTSLLADASGPVTPIYSETFLPRIHFGWSELRSLVDDRHHYIEAPRPELYDVAADPGEKNNVLGDRRREYASLKTAMQSYDAKFETPGNVSSEEAAKLAALGYLGSTRSETPDGPLADPKDGVADVETMKRASQLERSNDYRGAIALYRSILDHSPGFVDAWFRLAVAYESAGDDQQADSAYRRAISTEPSLAPGFASAYGWFLLRTGRLDEAASHARIALERSPGSAHLLLSSVALARGDATTAEREAKLAMDDTVRRPDAAVQLARVQVATGRLSEAVALLEETKRETAALGAVKDIDLVRGDALARMQRFAEAERAFEDEIRAHPENTHAYARLSILLLTQARPADSERALERMVAANPSRSAALLAADTCKVTDNPSGERLWRGRANRLP